MTLSLSKLRKSTDTQMADVVLSPLVHPFMHMRHLNLCVQHPNLLPATLRYFLKEMGPALWFVCWMQEIGQISRLLQYNVILVRVSAAIVGVTWGRAHCLSPPLSVAPLDGGGFATKGTCLIVLSSSEFVLVRSAGGKQANCVPRLPGNF